MLTAPPVEFWRRLQVERRVQSRTVELGEAGHSGRPGANLGKSRFSFRVSEGARGSDPWRRQVCWTHAPCSKVRATGCCSAPTSGQSASYSAPANGETTPSGGKDAAR